MSYFDDASLVMIPSGYKDQKVYSVKPIDGSGDLTFSRASNATRVNSSGLVEKVRTNLILQSNTFNTTWTNVNSTETSGQAGYDGTTNAWRLNDDAVNGSHDVRQVVSLSGSLTISVYAKAGTISWLKLFNGVDIAYFNLSTGVAGTGGGIMTSVGNGWYRCSISSNGTSSLALVGMTNADNTTSYAGDGTGTIFIQNAQLETGDIATDYIATTSAAVSVGPVSGLPRLDYSGGCPSLLLEPQRTNLALYSEQMDNAYYGKVNSSITANATTSPDGYTNADKLVDNTTNGYHAFETSGISTSIGAVYTVSLFAKKGEKSVLQILFDGGDVSGNPRANFDLQNGVLGSVDAAITATITDYGSGWYRCTATATSAVTSFIPIFCIVNSTTSSRVENYAGNGTDGLFVWGVQVEDGAYATSYIPTLSSAVTRVAENTLNTSASSLIGATEGAMFVEVKATFNTRNGRFMLLQGTSNNFIELVGLANGKVQAFVYNGSTQANIQSTSTYSTGDTLKIALAYKANDFVLYVNGTQQGTDTSGAIPASMDRIILNNYTGAGYDEANAYKQALLFKTRLSNADLATLTTL